MAAGAKIVKLQLSIADMDRHHYQDYAFNIAQHPSETPQRVMMRIITFALNAHEHLTFTKGISTDDEPDLWQKSLSDEIELWIDLGQPSEDRIRKACNKSIKSQVISYGDRSAPIWWQKMEPLLERFENLSVLYIENEDQLAPLLQRNMQLQINIQDGDLMISDEQQSINVSPAVWK